MSGRNVDMNLSCPFKNSSPLGPKIKWVLKLCIRALSVQVCLRSVNEERWYFDSGCARHMSGDISKFSTWWIKKENVSPIEIMGKVKITEKGDIGIPSSKTYNVLLVDGLIYNLLSIS